MCKKCLLKDQKKDPNQWEYGKFLWDSFSDIEKLFYITSRSEEEAEENQLKITELGKQKWEEIEMLHQWLLMCTINKFGPPNKGDVNLKVKFDHEINTFIHCKKCINENSPINIDAGWTSTGMSVRCLTHDIELAYVPLPSFMTRHECMHKDHEKIIDLQKVKNEKIDLVKKQEASKK